MQKNKITSPKAQEVLCIALNKSIELMKKFIKESSENINTLTLKGKIIAVKLMIKLTEIMIKIIKLKTIETKLSSFKHELNRTLHQLHIKAMRAGIMIIDTSMIKIKKNNTIIFVPIIPTY